MDAYTFRAWIFSGNAICCCTTAIKRPNLNISSVGRTGRGTKGMVVGSTAKKPENLGTAVASFKLHWSAAGRKTVSSKQAVLHKTFL